MILQKSNSERQWRWGWSDLDALAPVAIERHPRVESAKAVSAILYSCIMT